MKKLSILFAALFCMMTVSAKTIYCKQAQSWWKADGAAVGCYYWEGAGAPSWPGNRMTAVEGETDLWVIDIPDNTTGLIFVRVNGSGTIEDWGAKTADLSFEEGKNLYTITSTSPVWGDPGVTGEWGTFTIDATSIDIDLAIAEVEAGKVVTLTATVAPANATDKTITWTSDKPEIASVANGVVTGVSEGTATITATTHNGKTATCVVTVTPPAKTYVTSITVAPATLTLTAGDVSEALTVTVLPEDAADKTYTWASDNEEVATVADGIVTAVAKGTANITATANDGSGKVGTCVVTVNPKLYTFTIKVRDNLAWGKMNIYYWGDGVTTPDWPGDAMEKEGDWYVKTFTDAAPSIIINNGESGDNNQTIDILGITTDGCYKLGEEAEGKRSLIEIDCNPVATQMSLDPMWGSIPVGEMFPITAKFWTEDMEEVEIDVETLTAGNLTWTTTCEGAYLMGVNPVQFYAPEGSGEIEITATYGGLTATGYYTLAPAAPQLSIAPAEPTISADSVLQITASTWPEGEYYFQYWSEDENIATVDNTGKVTPTNPEGGTVKIYVGVEGYADVQAYAIVTILSIPTKTVYFSNNLKWNGTIYAFAWTDSNSKQYLGAWPGKAIDKVETNDYGEDIYQVKLPTAATGVIFNNNSLQSVDLEAALINEGYGVYLSKETDAENHYLLGGYYGYTKFTISTSVSDESHGSVTGGGIYAIGSDAVLEAIASEGYRFSKWSDETTENPRTITVSGDATYEAIFVEDDGMTGIEHTTKDAIEVRKVIENGQLIIIRDGVRYNVLGAAVK